MSMLKPASNRMAFAKIGLYGNAGSGKTYTAAKLAIGLHKAAKLTKPVAMFDTEPAASWIIPLFEEAKIEFLVYDESRALKDLMAFMDEAEQAASIIIIDSITHVWRDAQESYLRKINDGLKAKGRKPIYSLEFHHWRPIKAAWAKFTDRFLSSKAHVIVCGRAGAIYEYQENEQTGKKELITTGNRMATEKELGYEPSLLVEMVARRDDGRMVNVALIQKDRSAMLNGKEIDYPDFEKFRPHFDRLNIGGEHFESMEKRDSTEIFDDAEDGDGWAHELRNRKVWSEEILALMSKHHPGQSNEAKAKRADLMEEFCRTRSETKLENTPADRLKAMFHSMKAVLEPADEVKATA